jgi:hypothetical protein
MIDMNHDTNEVIMKFELDAYYMKKLAPWLKEQEAKNKGQNMGAIGGAFSYIFSPTSIGTMITVKNELTGDKIFLSDDL